jgi:hypothetical protein
VSRIATSRDAQFETGKYEAASANEKQTRSYGPGLAGQPLMELLNQYLWKS